MTGWLMPELHNAFPEIRIHYFHTLFFEVVVKVTFLSKHTLTLNNPGNALAFYNFMDDLVMLCGISGPMDLHAIGQCIPLKLLQITVHIGEGVVLDLRCPFTQLFPLRESVCGLIPFLADKP